MHPLVEELAALVERRHRAGLATGAPILDAFWAQVEQIGTPLLDQVDGRTRATFLFEQGFEEMAARGPYTRVWIETCTRRVDLEPLPQTNVWWAQVELPDDCTLVYTYHCADRDGTINNDIHEPWPVSFRDRYNRTPTQDVDSIDSSNIVTTKRIAPEVPAGVIRTINVPAALLPLVEHGQHPDTHPVWCYTPPQMPVDSEPLPLVVLMAGQFLESMDLAATLDHSIYTGRMPPAVVVAPGDYGRRSRRHGYKAWGWRNGSGPGELSAFFSQALLPAIKSALPVTDRAHLVAWNYTTYSAAETARRIPEQVASLILLDPWLEGISHSYLSTRITGGPGYTGHAYRKLDPEQWTLAQGLARLGTATPGLTIALGVPPRRVGDFAWTDNRTDHIRYAALEAGLPIAEFTLTDPNIVAAGEAIGDALNVALPPD